MHGQKKLIRAWLSIKALCLLALPLQAISAYEEAVEHALKTHPTIEAAKARIEEARSNVKVAYQGMHPRIRLEGEVGRARTNQKSPSRTTSSTSDPRNGSLSSQTATGVAEQSIRPKSRKAVIEQPLYKGGQISASIEAAKQTLEIANLQLKASMINLRSLVTQTYMAQLVAEARLDLYRKIEHSIRQHRDAAILTQKIGSGSMIDVAQAESRLAGAQADLLDAKTQLDQTKAQFEEYVGYTLSKLAFPALDLSLPSTRDQAIRQAELNNPDLLTLRLEERIAGTQVASVRGELLPSLSLRGESAQSDNQFFKNVKTISSGIYANLSIPLYNSGGSLSRLSATRAQQKQKCLAVADKLRSLRAEVSTVFDRLAAQRAKIKARDAEFKAADLALQGIRIEQKTGGKSMLNLLDAEQEALNAHLALLSSRADYVNASYTLYKLVGDQSTQ